MEKILFAVFLGLVFHFPATAQDNQDSEFTVTILAYENAIRYRPAPGKFLRSADGIRELGITSAQTTLINETISRGRSEIDKLVELMSGSRSADLSKELSGRHLNALQKLRAEILAILTPSQRKRLAQIAFQKHLSSSDSLSMYLHRSVQPFIQLNDSQQAELSKTVNNANAEYLEALLALNEKYRQKILNGVDRSIRDKVEPVVGEPWFRFQSRGKSVLSNDTGREK